MTAPNFDPFALFEPEPGASASEPGAGAPDVNAPAPEALAPIRDTRGRFLPGHHVGANRQRTSPVDDALASAGSSREEALHVLARETLAQAKLGDAKALERLDRWLMPAGRTVPGLFRGTRNAAQRGAAVVGAMAQGALSPSEAQAALRAVRSHAEATEWQRLEEAIENAQGGRPALPEPEVD